MKRTRSLGVALILALIATLAIAQTPAPATGQSSTAPTPATGAQNTSAPAAPAAPAIPPRPLMQVSCPAIAPPANPAQFHWKHGLAEYNAYAAAMKAASPAQQAEAFADFVQKFPDSDYKVAALEGEMQADYRAGQTESAIQVGQQLLATGKADAGAQVQVYYLVGGLLPSDIQLQSNLPLVAEAGQCGLKAMDRMEKPANVPEATFAQQQHVAEAIFQRAIGFVEWHRKNYAAAIAPLTQATRLNSKDPSSYYWLGLSQLYQQPADFLGGIFSLARASALAPNVSLITNYFQKAYTNYHGSTQGMQDVLNLAKTNTQPPANFNIVSFAQIQNAENEAKYKAELYKFEHQLPPANTIEGIEARLMRPDKAAKVWGNLRGVGLQLSGVVVRSTLTRLWLAVGKPYKAKNQADVQVDLVIHRLVRRGDTVNIIGVPIEYHTSPHLLIVLNKGRILPNGGPSRSGGR